MGAIRLVEIRLSQLCVQGNDPYREISVHPSIHFWTVKQIEQQHALDN